MGAATANFVSAIFDERPVAIAAEVGARAVHIAQAIDTASGASEQGLFKSAEVYTRRLHWIGGLPHSSVQASRKSAKIIRVLAHEAVEAE